MSNTVMNNAMCEKEGKFCVPRLQAKKYEANGTYKTYVCRFGNHWHLTGGGHKGRITQPHTLCDKCGREIRVRRWDKHVAKCEGLNTGERFTDLKPSVSEANSRSSKSPIQSEKELE